MAITTFDGLIAAMAASTAQRISQFGQPTIAGGARVSDLFMATATPMAWGNGSLPGSLSTSALCDRTTAGAIPYTNPVAASGFLAGIQGWVSGTGGLYLYDRLWHANVDCSINTSQNLSGATMTRPDGLGNDVELWVEADPVGSPGNIGTNALTITYTNQANVGSRSAVVGSSAANMSIPTGYFATKSGMWPCRLQAGDSGVRSVQSAQWTTAIGAGHCGLVLLRRIAVLPTFIQLSAGERDAFQVALSRIDSGACLALMGYFGNPQGSFSLSALLNLIEG